MNFYANTAKALLLLIFTACAVYGADGDLDATFDGDGIVVTDNGSNGEGIQDITVQPDGKILALGDSPVGSPSTNRAALVRYHSDGGIDMSFGTSGKVFVADVFPLKLALQPDGKIVFVGYTGTSPDLDFYVARLNANGSFDTAFNGTGSITLNPGGGNNLARSVKIQPDGKILVAGGNAIVRLNPNGSYDLSFDGDGIVLTNAPNSVSVIDVALQADGKIAATGSALTIDPPGSKPLETFVTLRYNADGSPDAAFGSGGAVFTRFITTGPFGSRVYNQPSSVLVQPDGKIIVAGAAGSCCAPAPQSQMAIIRLNADGAPDASFGTAGKALVSYLPGLEVRANDIALQADNKIVVAAGVRNIKNSFYGAARLNTNGSLDVTFSGDGWNVLPNASSPTFKTAAAVAIQADAKIVTGGNVAPNSDFMLARYESSICTANCIVIRQKILDFDGDGRTDLSVYRNGTWLISPSTANNPSSYYGVQFGLATDRLTPEDFDGDGKTDVAVWRQLPAESRSLFYILQSSTNSLRVVEFGGPGDDPRVVGDWDGDGRADPAIYRSGAGSQSVFFYLPSAQPSVNFVPIYWGSDGDEALRGDFDGDGRRDAAVFRPSNLTWYILQSSNNQALYNFGGAATDKRVSGDFDGDGKTDFAVFGNGVWGVLQSSNNQMRFAYWGLGSDLPVPGDYDGDGLTDFAVWREGVYYILRNANSQPAYYYFGSAGDVPAAAFAP